MITTQQYSRKPLIVHAVRITTENFSEVAEWCESEIEQVDIPGKGKSKRFIKVGIYNPKNVRQTRAFVGDWILKSNVGYKIYTHKAFVSSFDPVPGAEVETVKIKKQPVVAKSEGVTILTEDVPATPTTSPPEGMVFTTSSTEHVKPVTEVEVHAQGQDDRAIAVEDSPTAPPVPTSPVKTVISRADQAKMEASEIQELLKSGDYILEQDLPG